MNPVFETILKTMCGIALFIGGLCLLLLLMSGLAILIHSIITEIKNYIYEKKRKKFPDLDNENV